jgi:predicted ATPase/class 3 adenylate cyclase
MINLPSGTVTFLFTDIEGSTKLAQQYRDAMPALLARHNQILHQAIEAHNGYVFQVVGDSFAAAFHSASDALHAAADAQRALQNETWTPALIRVRMGIHTGAAQLQDSTDNPYIGYATIAASQRIMSAGYGGQVLLSGATRELVRAVLPADTELLDLGEKGLKDLMQPEHLYQLSIAGLPTTFPPLKTLDSFANNLPVQLTTFIGREKEIEQLKKRLEKNRLVTLTGSGGVGKTRLSIQVASELLASYPNGVWLVELAPLTDPALVPQTICSVLAVTIQGSTPALNALMDYLRSKKILLVFDNCEHLIDACAQLCETLLHACPQLRIITSSREALGIEGESAYRVPSLSIADPNSKLEMIEQSEAVRLFMERVNTILPGYTLTGVNAPIIAQICRRLDGIALAIELAASRVKLLKVEQIAARLDDAFRLLTGGSRTALPRQQTLRGAIDWSYNMLSGEEQTMFRRLAVFMGGWSLEAAEAVCEDLNTLDLLTHLADKSLVVVDRERSHETRYLLLETIRQYAREKLVESGEMLAMRQRHLMHFLAFAETKGTETRGSNQMAALKQLDEEYENIREAMEWAIETDQVEEATRIGITLVYLYWFSRGLSQEGYQKITLILNHPATTKEKRFRAAALTIAALYAPSTVWNTGRGQALIEEAIEISKLAGEKGKIDLAVAYGIWGLCMIWKDNAVAEKALDMGLSVAREVNDKHNVDNLREFHLANLTEFRGYLARVQKDYSRAREFSKESIRLFRELGNHWGIARGLENTGLVCYSQGNYDEAQKQLEESLTIYRSIADKPNTMGVLGFLGQISALTAKYERAEVLLEESLFLAKDRGWTQDIRTYTRDLAYLKLYQGNSASALALFRESLTLFENSDEAEMSFHIAGIASAIFELSPQHAEHAAKLLGSVQLILDETENLPYTKEQINKTLKAVRACLGEVDYQRFASQGKAMLLDDVIALAKQVTYE